MTLAQLNPAALQNVEPAFWGQWIIVALAILGGLGGLAAVASYFATRRELVSLEHRVGIVERDQRDDRKANEIHASERSKTIFAQINRVQDQMNSRLDPLVENTASLKGSHEAFTTSFTNFTRLMEKLLTERSTPGGKL